MSAGVARARKQLMEHLVEDDVLHEEERDVLFVEGRVNANLAGSVIVDP
jgi:hypothetical protein